MSYWSLYFLLKVGLFYAGLLDFHWIWNALLACAVLWPMPSRWGPWGVRLRLHLSWPLALLLLYHDSYLPPLARVLSQLHVLSNFSTLYVLELLSRTVQWPAVLALLGITAVYRLLSHRLRMASFALLAIASVPATQVYHQLDRSDAARAQAQAPLLNANATEPGDQLKGFYQQEGQRRLRLATDAQPAFDIIVLHVCSLAWDDLDFVDLRSSFLSQKLDLVFRNFNTASSYSGPASIRVLRGACGQTAHNQLYQSADPDCYVFPSLESVGYQTVGLLNHNGIFDGFASRLEQLGGLAGRLDRKISAPAHMQAFDGSPIADDFALLSRWWTQRLNTPEKPVALFYNTITLHDGNLVPGSNSQLSLETYKPRLIKLLSDFDRFFSLLENSGRPVVVMLIPEHGASLRGDRSQIAGIREIPGPKVTLGPAAIRLVGLKTRTPSNGPLVLDQPVSYYGLMAILKDLLVESPFNPGARTLQSRVQRLEITPYVAENEDLVVLRNAAGKYLMHSADGVWLPYQD